MNRQYYTVKEVSEMLGVCDKTIQRWIHAGKLEAVKIGREYRIEKGKFNELLEAHKTIQK